MKKKNLWIMAVTMLTLAITIPTYAGTWKQDTIGWWYQNDDSSYPKSSWQWIDGNNDGIAECYYFNENGYILTNTITPDSYQVDANGAWIINNVIQTKDIAASSGAETKKDGTGSSTNGVGVGGINQETKNEDGYVVKRIGTRWSKKINGGTTYGYNDYTGWKTFGTQEVYQYKKDKDFAIDGEIFCPDNVRFPNCVLKEVVLDGSEVVKVTPIWINNGEWDYGGFSNPPICGRLEWRKFERNDPEYAVQLKSELTEEAKQRAFEIYPNMIVDYSN